MFLLCMPLRKAVRHHAHQLVHHATPANVRHGSVIVNIRQSTVCLFYRIRGHSVNTMAAPPTHTPAENPVSRAGAPACRVQSHSVSAVRWPKAARLWKCRGAGPRSKGPHPVPAYTTDLCGLCRASRSHAGRALYPLGFAPGSTHRNVVKSIPNFLNTSNSPSPSASA